MKPPLAAIPLPAHHSTGAPPLAWTIALHVIPGAVFASIFALAVGPMREAGIPPMGTFAATVVLVLVPLELGYLLHRGRLRNGRLSLTGVIANLEPMPARSYALWIPALYAVSFVLFAVAQTLTTPWLKDTFFAWVPVWMDDPFGFDDPARYGSTTLLITWIAGVTINGVAGPLVEEMYFRGHLLPHLARLGRWAPVANSALFALYHFASPWQFFARALGLMPLFYFVWRRRNIYVGIAVHCALNTIGALVVLPRLLALV